MNNYPDLFIKAVFQSRNVNCFFAGQHNEGHAISDAPFFVKSAAVKYMYCAGTFKEKHEITFKSIAFSSSLVSPQGTIFKTECAVSYIL